MYFEESFPAFVMIPASIKKLRDFSGDFAMDSASFLVEAGRILPVGARSLATLDAAFAERFAMTILRTRFMGTPILDNTMDFGNRQRPTSRQHACAFLYV